MVKTKPLEDIIKEIEKLAEELYPLDYIASNDFEKWLRKRSASSVTKIVEDDIDANDIS